MIRLRELKGHSEMAGIATSTIPTSRDPCPHLTRLPLGLATQDRGHVRGDIPRKVTNEGSSDADFYRVSVIRIVGIRNQDCSGREVMAVAATAAADLVKCVLIVRLTGYPDHEHVSGRVLPSGASTLPLQWAHCHLRNRSSQEVRALMGQCQGRDDRCLERRDDVAKVACAGCPTYVPGDHRET